MRNPIKATAREPINRPDTYERFPKSCQILNCEQQPTHTEGPFTINSATTVRNIAKPAFSALPQLRLTRAAAAAKARGDLIVDTDQFVSLPQA
ncbi:MAG: hypothetical protein JJU15_01955 [Pararhodobacter sp.]|nr:hypothetical protein [Pararhodobacter sp.]